MTEAIPAIIFQVLFFLALVLLDPLVEHKPIEPTRSTHASGARVQIASWK
jgi:hypothetical protein